MLQTKLYGSLLTFVVLVIALMGTSRSAYGLAFAPTEQEWNAWTDICRARYTVSGSGMGSKFENRVSKADVARYQAAVGPEGWVWLHHYCAGLVYLDRALKEQSEIEAAKWLREAEANVQGHYNRLSKTHQMFPETVITLARVYREMGDTDAALGYLKEAMKYQPKASSPYALAAIIYRDDGDLDSALRILLSGNEANNSNSAEIHFLLGHIYIDLDDLDSAVIHAKRAYELGYPLPGLAVKLQRLGRNVE